jgi:hypothetical protein
MCCVSKWEREIGSRPGLREKDDDDDDEGKTKTLTDGKSFKYRWIFPQLTFAN